jgi:hypothetical protein
MVEMRGVDDVLAPELRVGAAQHSYDVRALERGPLGALLHGQLTSRGEAVRLANLGRGLPFEGRIAKDGAGGVGEEPGSSLKIGHDLAAHVHPRVVVVSLFGRGHAVSNESDGGAEGGIRTERIDEHHEVRIVIPSRETLNAVWDGVTWLPGISPPVGPRVVQWLRGRAVSCDLRQEVQQ